MQCLRWVRNCANNLLLYKENDISDSDHWQIFCSIANSSWHRLRNFIFEKVNGFVLACNIRCKMNEYIQCFLRKYLIPWMYSCSYNYSTLRKYNINNESLEHKDLIWFCPIIRITLKHLSKKKHIILIFYKGIYNALGTQN